MAVASNPGVSMAKTHVRFLVTTLAAGVLFCVSIGFLMGLVAARPFPGWYAPFASENPLAAIALWEFFVKIPAVIVLSVLWSLILYRLCPGKLPAAGLCTLLVAVGCAFLVANKTNPTLDAAFLQTAARYLLPGYILQVPTSVALYLSLPVACWYIERKEALK